jgi:hypothetical protein
MDCIQHCSPNQGNNTRIPSDVVGLVLVDNITIVQIVFVGLGVRPETRLLVNSKPTVRRPWGRPCRSWLTSESIFDNA